ncbi:MAG: DUF4276 family protein [Nitrospirae bacterium]|nr:DUF4276 family protein [Nitrospirota bacterium]
MSKPAFIVDGQQEQKILQQLCPDTPVRRLNLNGKDAELHAAAKRIASLIRLLGNRYYPFVIIYDREDRSDSVEIIREELERLIKSEGINDDIVIGIPDRMIENWLLADWLNTQQQGKLMTTKEMKTFEGNNGKATILKHLPKGSRYHETVEGVNWFLKADVKNIYKNSHSFRLFANVLQNISCSWLNSCLKDIRG